MTIFEAPTLTRIAVYVASVALVFGIHLLFARLFRQPFRLTMISAVYIAVQTVALFLCDDLRALLNIAFLIWSCFGENVPWDKLKKKLKGLHL